MGILFIEINVFVISRNFEKEIKQTDILILIQPKNHKSTFKSSYYKIITKIQNILSILNIQYVLKYIWIINKKVVKQIITQIFLAE